MKTLYFITSNKGKVKELQKKLSPLQIHVVQHDIGYPEPQVDTIEEVARYGVEYLQKKGIDHPFILEDSGISIHSLQDFPGVYSKYVYQTIGLQGILRLMDSHDERRHATFRSVIAYAEPKGPPRLFIGECKGTITTEEHGTNGFGYDPLFTPKGSEKTFAEMDTTLKNTYSHRGQSVQKLINYLHDE